MHNYIDTIRFTMTSQKRLCELLETSKVELLKWRKNGLKVYSAPNSHRIYYDLDEVKAFIKSNQIN